MSILKQGEFTPKEARAEIKRFANALPKQDLSPIFKEIEYIFRQDIHQHFIDNRGPEEAWAPHAPETIRRHGPHPLLRLTYAMHTAATRLGASGNLAIFRPREMISGVDGNVVNYASYQHYGTNRIPARPFIWISDEAEEDAATEFERLYFEMMIGQ